VTQICALIAAAVAPKDSIELYSEFKSTRDGTLAFVIIGMILCLAIFIIYIINLYKKFEKPLKIAVSIYNSYHHKKTGLSLTCYIVNYKRICWEQIKKNF
jgi:hypothetical protein